MFPGHPETLRFDFLGVAFYISGQDTWMILEDQGYVVLDLLKVVGRNRKNILQMVVKNRYVP